MTTLFTKFGHAPLSMRSLMTMSASLTHLFQRAKREKGSGRCLWTRGTVPSEWMEVPALWDEAEPCVSHNSCAQLKEWAESNFLIMFCHGTCALFSSDLALRRCGWGVAVLDFTDVFVPSMVFGRGEVVCQASRKPFQDLRSVPEYRRFALLFVNSSDVNL